mmetsp:Transcript_1656/g.3147  ORF Transcript_1656/g.3147 Transcript_1656/m.3147 type:complete len:215 (-) Transcript_1656:1704-2348(-)
MIVTHRFPLRRQSHRHPPPMEPWTNSILLQQRLEHVEKGTECHLLRRAQCQPRESLWDYPTNQQAHPADRQGNKRYPNNMEPSTVRLVVPSASSKPPHLPCRDRCRRPPPKAQSTLLSTDCNFRNTFFRDNCSTCCHCLLSSLPIAIWRHRSELHNSLASRATQYHPNREDWSPLRSQIDGALSIAWEEDHLLDTHCRLGIFHTTTDRLSEALR